jgi:hypothetical protein
MPRPAVHVVHDPEDSPQHAQFLAQLHSLSDGQVCAEVRTLSDASSLATAVWDVLYALGKQPDIHGETTATWQALEWCACWLRAHGINRLIINRAHILNWRDWQSLTEMAVACNVELWLVFQRGALNSRYLRFITNWNAEVLDWQHFHKSMPASTRGRPARSRAESYDFPVVPDEDWTQFLPTARRVLDSDDYQLVRRVVVKFARAASEWLDRRAEVTIEQASAFALESIETAVTADEALARLRGIQIGAFHMGWNVRVSAEALRSRRDSQPAADFTEGAAMRLGWYANPMHPALGALTLAAGFDQAEIAAVDMSAVSETDASINAGGVPVALPAHAMPALWAQQRVRLLEGPDCEALFISTYDRRQGYRRLTPASVAHYQGDIEETTGLLLKSSLARSPDRTKRTALYSYGVTLKPIAGKGNRWNSN